MQLREIRLTGPSKEPASLTFSAGGNIISGASDTGKSFVVFCIDYVLGATELEKKIDEANGYELAYLHFVDDANNSLTLVRNLSGGDIQVFETDIDHIEGAGKAVAWKKKGKSADDDVSSVFLPFAKIPGEVRLLSSASKSTTKRMSVRLLLPAFMVKEGSILADHRSPMYGDAGYDNTSRKRVLSYLLTGQDDSGIISAGQTATAQANARAKISLIDDLLKPIEQRVGEGQPFKDGEHVDTIERADETINRLSNSLAENREERVRLQAERADALASIQSAEGQIVAIGELLTRYSLLNSRYESDLRRLDFVAEGSYFFEQLQEARCPMCDQPMSEEHIAHVSFGVRAKAVYRSAKAEAAKINGLKADLSEAITSLQGRRDTRQTELTEARKTLDTIDRRVDRDLAPALLDTKKRLNEIIHRRVQLEAIKSDNEQVEALKLVRTSLESQAQSHVPMPKVFIDSFAINDFNKEVEAVLKEWAWKGEGRVSFDEKECDIVVDGKARHSHGKGIRAILHAAFIVGLLRYCQRYQKPHPRFIILDSPLTTFKQRMDGTQAKDEHKIDPGIEHAFWESIAAFPKDLQVIVFDNKEPPASVAAKVPYTRFTGPEGNEGERNGFIPL